MLHFLLERERMTKKQYPKQKNTRIIFSVIIFKKNTIMIIISMMCTKFIKRKKVRYSPHLLLYTQFFPKIMIHFEIMMALSEIPKYSELNGTMHWTKCIQILIYSQVGRVPA